MKLDEKGMAPTAPPAKIGTSAKKTKAPATEAGSRTNKGQKRIAEIIDAARNLFIEGGYGEMTMRQVAERVGMTLSNLQHYFPSRESLLSAVLWDVANRYDLAYAELNSRRKNPQEKFKAVINYLIADVQKSETERLFVEIWALAARDPLARQMLDQMYVHHRRGLEQLIAEANPRLTPKQVPLRAGLIAMQIEGLLLLLSDTKPKHQELKGIDQECVRMIMLILNAD